MAARLPNSQKKLKKTIFTSSMTEQCDMYSDALDNEGYRGTILNWFKNLEKEFKTIRSFVDRNRQTQIKDEQSLADLSKSVKFTTDKFHK